MEPELMADTIEGIMCNSERYDQLSMFARKYVMENYDYRMGAERLERAYRDALNDPPLGRLERIRLFLTNLFYGYGRRCYIAWRLKLRVLVGRGRPEDSVIP
ncbi:MAG: hypothetical protein KAX38_02800 [Candidatus Krumholzibacteria bacterium]|nr:hypothetical protein [Candidatus Krumholzibacteria bacterium]